MSDRLGQRIVSRLEELAALSEEAGRLTRPYLSASHRRAADLILGWMRDTGMTARIDAVGNTRGRYESESPDAPTLLLGSHIDTVRDAGIYDGNLGVVLAIEALQHLHQSGRRLSVTVEVVAFGDEEGLRFPSTLSGSRAMAGRFDLASLDERDSLGIARRDALVAFGCDVRAIAEEVCDPSVTLAYVEVHIEQGPVLEVDKVPVGIVTAINGARRGTVTVEGIAAHAGTAPMALRCDALVAAAEMIVAVERIARGKPDLVGTVGRLELHPGSVNTVPGRVTFSIDIRSPQDAERDAALVEIQREIERVAESRSVSAHVAWSYRAAAAPCDARLVSAFSRSVQNLGLLPRLLPSGAGHDAMAFHGHLPFGMLFVRSHGGVSHNAREFTSVSDIDIAARVLVDFLDNFDPESLAKGT